MHIAGHLIYLFAQCLESVGSLFRFSAGLLNGFLPVFLTPARLTQLTQKCYRKTYTEEFSARILTFDEQHLTPWETDILGRYNIRSGRMLVLGAGSGRETIAIARRGLEVIGVESNDMAVRTASSLAKHLGARAHFHHADFLHLPYGPASFDYVLLSSTMYSAIPGMSLRQAWLNNLLRLLLPTSLVILSFETRQAPRSRLGMLRIRLNQILAKLPGANSAYQIGDNCTDGHFLHEFQDEEDIRRELVGTGLVIMELNWPRGFAILTHPLRTPETIAIPARKLVARSQ
jgi:SAM-dependent methyltransferase